MEQLPLTPLTNVINFTTKSPITAQSSKLALSDLSYDVVRYETEKYFESAEVVNPLGELSIATNGRVNEDYRLTSRGFASLCTYFGINAATVEAFWEIDAERSVYLLNERFKGFLKGSKLKKLRLLTHGDKIEGFATNRYGEIPTLEVLEQYNSLNPEVEYKRVLFDGLRARYTTLAAEAQSIEPVVGDVCRVGNDFQNSQDGSLSFTINLILWRLVCSNGMLIGEKGCESRIVHKGNAALDKCLSSLSIDNLDLVTLQERLMSSTTINLGEDRMEFLFNKVFQGVSKKFAKMVVREYDHPTCPSAKPGNTLYDFWNATTHAAKSFGEDQRKAEKFAYQLLVGKIPQETSPVRPRTSIEA